MARVGQVLQIGLKSISVRVVNKLRQEEAEQSESYLIVLVGDGGPTGQAGHDLGWEQVLALAGDWDDAVL